LKESRILFFFYIYFAHTYINIDEKKREPLLVIWTELIKFLNIFESSKNPNTLFWIIEIIHLFSKRYWPEVFLKFIFNFIKIFYKKEVLSDPGLQKSLHNQTNDLFSKVASICSNKYELIFNPILPNLASKDKKKQSIISTITKYEIVVPFPPTIYQMRKKYYEREKKNDSPQDIKQELFGNKELNKDIKRELFDVEKEICRNKIDGNIDELSKIYRLMGFKILNIFALSILKQTHPAQKVERIVERVIFIF